MSVTASAGLTTYLADEPNTGMPFSCCVTCATLWPLMSGSRRTWVTTLRSCALPWGKAERIWLVAMNASTARRTSSSLGSPLKLRVAVRPTEGSGLGVRPLIEVGKPVLRSICTVTLRLSLRISSTARVTSLRRSWAAAPPTMPPTIRAALTATRMPPNGTWIGMACRSFLLPTWALAAAAGCRRHCAGDGCRFIARCRGDAGDQRRGALRAAELRQQRLQANLAQRRLEGLAGVGPTRLQHLKIAGAPGAGGLAGRLEIERLAGADKVDQRPARLVVVDVAVAVEVDRERRAVAPSIVENDEMRLNDVEVGAVDLAVTVEVDQVLDVVRRELEHRRQRVGTRRGAIDAGPRRAADDGGDLGRRFVGVEFEQDRRQGGDVRCCLRGAAAQPVAVADTGQGAHDIDAGGCHVTAGVGERGAFAVAAERFDDQNIGGLLEGWRLVSGRKAEWACEFGPVRRRLAFRIVAGGGHDQDAVLEFGGQPLHRAGAVEDVRFDVLILVRVLAELEAVRRPVVAETGVDHPLLPGLERILIYEVDQRIDGTAEQHGALDQLTGHAEVGSLEPDLGADRDGIDLGIRHHAVDAASLAVERAGDAGHVRAVAIGALGLGRVGGHATEHRIVTDVTVRAETDIEKRHARARPIGIDLAHAIEDGPHRRHAQHLQTPVAVIAVTDAPVPGVGRAARLHLGIGPSRQRLGSDQKIHVGDR